jgi:hypothetical protein
MEFIGSAAGLLLNPAIAAAGAIPPLRADSVAE